MDGVESLKQRVDALAGLVSVNPDALSGDAALAWVKTVAQVIHASEAVLAPLATRIQELSDGPSRYARWKGFPSASALIAHATGLSQSQARAAGELGRVMTREIPIVVPPGELDFDGVPGVPDAGQGAATPHTIAGRAPAPLAPVMALSPLAQAAKAGSLGEPKIRVIAKTLEDMTVNVDALERELVERAASLSLRELRILCLRRFAELDPQGYETRLRTQSAEAEIKFFPRADGMVGISGQLDQVRGAHVMAWFEAEGSAAMQAQRGWEEHEKRTIGQINADVLTSLARHAEGCREASTRPKTTVVVRVDEQSLREGTGMAMCDSLEAPISIEMLRRMAVDAEIIPEVMGGKSMPLDVGRALRSFTDGQRIALGERDQGCASCHAPLPWCDAHHIEFWARGGRTDLENGVMLCVGCHHRVHDCGWVLEVIDGTVTFIPPATTDPRRRRRLASSARLAA